MLPYTPLHYLLLADSQWQIADGEEPRQQEGLNKVCLSGGVFQNVTLLSRTLRGLRKAGFEPYNHHLVPPNDGGIALGQALVAHFSSQAT